MHQQLSAGCSAAMAHWFACPHRGQTEAASALVSLSESEAMAMEFAGGADMPRDRHAVSQCTAQARRFCRGGSAGCNSVP